MISAKIKFNIRRVYTMKKLLAILLACTALTCSFAGCGSKDSSDNGGSSTVEEAKSPEIGKWLASDEAVKPFFSGLEDYIGDDNEIIIELKESGDFVMNMKVDYKGIILDGDYMMISDGAGQEVKTAIDYDGKYIYLNENVKFLERIGEKDEDNIYGEYKVVHESLKERYGDYIFEFSSSGKTYMKGSQNGKYEYDEENKTLSTMEDGEDHDDDPDKVEFNGDKMILTSSDGQVAEFTRID